jgi:hypothetical protein
VSPQYKDSATCRAEAKYGMARERTHDLKIVYVKSISELAGNNALLTTNEAWLADKASGKLIPPMELSSRNENSKKRFSSPTATATATAFESPFESERKSSSGKAKDVQAAWAKQGMLS